MPCVDSGVEVSNGVVRLDRVSSGGGRGDEGYIKNLPLPDTISDTISGTISDESLDSFSDIEVTVLIV